MNVRFGGVTGFGRVHSPRSVQPAPQSNPTALRFGQSANVDSDVFVRAARPVATLAAERAMNASPEVLSYCSGQFAVADGHAFMATSLL